MWRLFRFLNLDIVLGVAGLHLLVCTGGKVSLDSKYFIFLLSSTWLVYSMDRLFEINQKKHLYSELHLWYKNHFLLLSFWAATLGMAVLWSFYSLNQAYKLAILLPSGVGLSYYLGLRFIKQMPWLKDILIALTYTLAVTLPLWLELDEVTFDRIIIVAGLFILALLNMIFTSFADQDLDLMIGETNAFHHKGFKKHWKILVCSSLVILCVFNVMLWNSEIYLIASFCFFAALSYLLLLFLSNCLGKTQLFMIRMFADFVLMLSFPAYLLAVWFGLC